MGKALCKVHLSTFTRPEAHTDFAFAVWAQEMGFVELSLSFSCGSLCILFDSALLQSISRDEFGKMVTMGITFAHQRDKHYLTLPWFCIMPVTGEPLPFISYGGSSLLMNFMAIGLLASVGRRNVEGVKQVGTAEVLPSFT